MRTYIELAEAGAPNPLLPATAEIIVGSIAFLLLFLVMISTEVNVRTGAAVSYFPWAP